MTSLPEPTEIGLNAKQIKTRLLRVILWFVVAGNFLSIILLLPQYREQVFIFIIPILVTTLICLGLFPIIRRGHITLASIILLCGMWMVLLAYVLISGGLRSPTYPLFIVFIFASGLLLGEKAGVWAVTANLIASLGIFIASSKGYLPLLIPANDTSFWLNSIITFLIIGGLHSLYARWTQSAFERAQQELFVRTKVENELRRNQSLLTLAQQIGKIGHFSIDIETGAINWSDQLFRLFDMQPGEVEVTPELFRKFIHKDDLHLITNLQQEALSGLRSECELRMLTKEGHIRYVHVVANLMSPSSPKKIVLGTVQDISERKNAELAHISSEERYQTFLEQATEGIWRLEFDQPISTELTAKEQVHLIHSTGYIAECNDAFAHMYGYRSHFELDGKRLLELYGGHTSDVNVQATLKLVEDGYRSGNRETLEYNAAGEPVYFLNNALGIIQNNNLVAIWGTQQDISSLKKIQNALQESEEIFRSIIEQSYDGIVLINEQGVIVQWNQAMETMTGLASNEAIGKLYQDIMIGLLPTEQQKDIYTIEKIKVFMEGLTQEGDSSRNTRIIEQELQQPDGSLRFFQQSLSPIKVQNGYLFCRITRDITSQKKSAEEIQRLNAELEQRVQERTHQLATAINDIADFSYSIAHDLRAPLRGIDGYSNFMLEDYKEKLDEQGIKYLTNVRQGAQHMGRLLDDMLILLRVIRADLKPVEMNLSHLVENILESYQRQNPDHPVVCKIEPDLKTSGDPSLLITLFDNLLNNAWKFSQHFSPAVIEFGACFQDNMRVFFIRDNGIGFDMAHTKRLFSAFQRLHPAEEYEGTGIGLAIAQRIVQRHGGVIWAESEVNKGTTIKFTLETK